MAHYALAEPAGTPAGITVVRVDHHLAHAYSAFLPSAFDSATIVVEEWKTAAGRDDTAAVAAALQTRIGDLLIEFLTQTSRSTTGRSLRVGGGLFYNTYFNSLVKCCPAFEAVFVPINPDNAGLALGLSLFVSGEAAGHAVSRTVV